MKRPLLNALVFGLCFLFVFSMCKTENKTDITTTDDDSGQSIQVNIDSSLVDYGHMTDFEYVSLPSLGRWNIISNSLLKLDKNPNGYIPTDTLSWLNPFGKSFMSISHYTKSNEEDIDYDLFYERLRTSYPYSDYSYTKYNVGKSQIHEINLSNDSLYNYKLVIPKGNELISIDLMAFGDGYNQEIKDFVSQIPALVTIH